ncbi:MAG: response regulator [Candidatus Omnitrophota bacterium]
MNKKKILVVDDEVDLVDTLTIRLEASNYEVIKSYDGVDALERARKENPDLIILDIMLPKLDGFKVCRMLKFSEKYRGIPILMLTARSQEEDKIIGKEVGANTYITKPFDTEALLSNIKALLKE